MKLDFSYYMPTRIIFGCGKLSELETTPYLPGKKALVVIGAAGAMKKHGYLDRVTKYLNKNGVETVVYDRIQPNPVSEHVEEGASVARENNCDFVVGLGGGSSIDSAKSIAVMAVNPGRYWDYIARGSGGGKTPAEGALPIVAITTTAGTGTEADPWTVITRSETNEKIGWGANCTFPCLSIVDPELMASVPAKTTAYTGMDAFFHSVETYLATVNQPTSDLLALEAVGLITKYLPVAVKDGTDMQARTKLARGRDVRDIVSLHISTLDGTCHQRVLSRSRSRRRPDDAFGFLLQLPGREKSSAFRRSGAGDGRRYRRLVRKGKCNGVYRRVEKAHWECRPGRAKARRLRH